VSAEARPKKRSPRTARAEAGATTVNNTQAGSIANQAGGTITDDVMAVAPERRPPSTQPAVTAATVYPPDAATAGPAGDGSAPAGASTASHGEARSESAGSPTAESGETRGEPARSQHRRTLPKPAKKGPIPPTRPNIAAALSYLPPDLDRETWIKIGMAIKNALGEDGFETFDGWSKGGQSYHAADCRDAWKSIRTGGKTTIASLWRLALDAGWQPGSEAHQETEAERLERERQQTARAERDAKRKARKAREAARKAIALEKYVTPALPDHPYLVRKNILPTETLFEAPAEQIATIIGYLPQSDGEPLTGRVLVAFVEIGGQRTTAEFIDEQGRKSALAGGPKSGGYWPAQPLPEGDSDGDGRALLIGEGVATALSARVATGYLAVAALSASNLPKAATALRERYPAARLVLLGDIGNSLKYAEQAAQAVGAALAVPRFAPEHIQAFQEEHGKPPTDFNDLAALTGLEEVRRQIEGVDQEGRDVMGNPGEPGGQEKSSEEMNTTLPALPTLARDTAYTEGEKSYTDSYTEPKKPTPSEHGAFVYLADNGAPKLVIESKAARIMAGQMREAMYAYDVEAGCWHRYTGHCWALLPSAAEPERFILKTLYEDTHPIGFRRAYFNGILDIIQRAGMLSLPPKPVGKIPFKNGLLDIATRRLEPTTPATAATFFIPHDYTGSSDCPVFREWLRSATGNDDGLIQLLRAFIAAALTGRADLQKFLHLLGPGGTGKSTFIRLLFALVGTENAVTTDLRQLEQNRFEPACLHGKRLAAITDSDKYGGAVNVLKAVTGQDPVRHERKHVQQSGTFVFEGMVVIASNEPLASTDYTSGLARRRLVVKFDRRIPPHEKAAFLAAGGEARLHEEIPAIINWALELSREDVTRLFMNPPAKAAEAAFEALTAQNPIAEWITENLVPASGQWLGIGVNKDGRTPEGRAVFEEADTKLYPNYLRWCSENKREALSLRRFRHAAVDMLKTLGVDVLEARRGTGQGIQGVRLRNPAESIHSWSAGPVQDESYTGAGPSVGKDGLEAAPVQDVKEMQDFSNIIVGKNSAPQNSPCSPWKPGQVQDESYTDTLPSVGKDGLEAAPVQDVKEMQDFSNIIVGKNSEAESRSLVACADCRHFQRDRIGDGSGIGRCKVLPDPPGPLLYPRVERICEDFDPATAKVPLAP
jgi:putative DNA primase/helicase